MNSVFVGTEVLSEEAAARLFDLSMQMVVDAELKDPSMNEVRLHISEVNRLGFAPVIERARTLAPWLGPVMFGQLNPTSRRPSVHDHSIHHALLYYVHLKWDRGWMGGTIFLNSEKTRITGHVPYTPKSFVIIPKGLVHSMLPTSDDSPKYRLTATIFMGNSSADSTS